MELIKHLVTEKYNLINVGINKCPVDKDGFAWDNWQNKKYDELVANHNYSSTHWGIKLGEQENGRCILSLDFDVYNKTTDCDCEPTKKLLEAYSLQCENSNGMYSSSTDGNMNILVDYSNSDIIKDYVKRLGKNKFSKMGLEVLTGGNQVIPPSQTICKKTKQLGKARTFENQEQPFYVIDKEDDFTCLFIKELFEEKFKSMKQPTRIFKSQDDTDSETTTDDDVVNIKDKFLDLLFNVIKNERDRKGNYIIDWNTWFQIAGILKHNHYERDMFIKYSGEHKGNDIEAGKLWDAIGNSNMSMSIYGLQNIARRINHQGYKDWLIKYNEFLHLEILEKGENDIATFISKGLIMSLVFCRNEWWEYNSKTGLWVCIKEPSATITTFIQRKIDESLECLLAIMASCDDEAKYKQLNNKKKQYLNHYSQVCKSGFNNMVVKYLKSYLTDNEFYKKLDYGLYKMVYRNGILDLKTMYFKRGITQNDFITKTIPFDYEKPTDEDIAFVRENLKKICNYNEAHLNYYLSSLGYAFTGDSSREQKFWYLRGQTAENGKSIVFEVLELLMPNYVKKGGSDVLDKDADLRKEIATWVGARLLWLNEVSVKRKDEDLVKALCDGTGYKYNRLYSVEAIIMPITFKLFAVSNNTLTIKGDAGVKRRFVLEQFNSQFKEREDDDFENLQFKRDTDFKAKLLGEYKHALIYLILTYSNLYFKKQKLEDYPSEWREDGDEVMADNNKFEEWFLETFEIGEGYFVHKTTFDFILNNSKFKHVTIKDELARMRVSYKYDSQTVRYEDGIRKKGFWLGFRERVEEGGEEGLEEI
jgi:phage/plasmid-associated DNA primase